MKSVTMNPGYGSVPGNKILFNLLFGEFLCREWLNPTACTAQEFAAFVKKHGTVMVKPACDGCGPGHSSLQLCRR